MEGHGREEIIEGVDISRTVGWFTSQYPIILDMSYSKDTASQIKEIKENLRHIPKNGIGYSILKYLGDSDVKNSIGFNLEPEISFNYLGQFEEEITSEGFDISSLSVGQVVRGNSETLYSIDISGIIAEGKLNMSFKYNEEEYCERTILNMAEIYIKKLKEIIRHCLSKNDTELTPMDLGAKEISIGELEEYSAELESMLLELD